HRFLPLQAGRRYRSSPEVEAAGNGSGSGEPRRARRSGLYRCRPQQDGRHLCSRSDPFRRALCRRHGTEPGRRILFALMTKAPATGPFEGFQKPRRFDAAFFMRSFPDRAGGAVQMRRRPFRLAWPSLPMMMWSWTVMPSGMAVSMMVFVMSISAREGVGSPLGWLCTRMMAVADNSSARRTTSRG